MVGCWVSPKIAPMLSRLRGGGGEQRWGRGSWIAVGVAAAIVLLVVVATGVAFRDSFLSNFLATLAGVAIGVPVAVWLSSQEATEQGREARKREAAESVARRNQVLVAIRTEIQENRDTLAERRASGKREYYIPFLQDEVWAAMSDGGELRWVADPALLRQIARSYLYARTIMYLEKEVFAARHYPGMQVAGPSGKTNATVVAETVTGYLDHLDGVALAAFDEALAPIKAALDGS